MTGTTNAGLPNACDAAIRGQQLRAVITAARTLTARQRVVIRMRYVDERTWSQIGIALQITESAAVGLHNRAIGSIRRLLAVEI